MTHTQRELALTHKANLEEQLQTQKPSANHPGRGREPSETSNGS